MRFGLLGSQPAGSGRAARVEPRCGAVLACPPPGCCSYVRARLGRPPAILRAVAASYWCFGRGDRVQGYARGELLAAGAKKAGPFAACWDETCDWPPARGAD